MTVTRRDLLKSFAIAGVCGAGLGVAGRLLRAAPAVAEPVILSPRKIEASIAKGAPTKGVYSYGEAGMAPTLRMKQGEPFAARLVNGLEEPTTIHWHGLRIDNKMDGVPYLTQDYVETGQTFDYSFTPPDAGTFWYHPHCNTLEQMGRGLTGLIIVEGKDDPTFDAEFAVNLKDWRLGKDGQFIDQFRLADAGKSGTFGTVRTANWVEDLSYAAPAGGLVRLRFANTDVTRIYSMRMSGAVAHVIAIDGNPVPKRFALDLVMVGPGQRIDLAVLMPETEGAAAEVVDVRGTSQKTLVSLKSVGSNLKRAIGDLGPLQANFIKPADLGSAEVVPVVLSATAESVARPSMCGSLGASFWAINKVPYEGDGPDPMAPLAELKLGKSYILRVENLTQRAHPMHLHGMSFTVMSSTTREVEPLVTDTYLVMPNERVDLALVADNVGDWALHCHIIEHQKTGMTAFIRVA